MVVLLVVREMGLKGFTAVMDVSHNQKQSDRLKAIWCITETLSAPKMVVKEYALTELAVRPLHG